MKVSSFSNVRIVIMISGGGSNALAIIKYIQDISNTTLPIEIIGVIADREAKGIDACASLGIATYMFSKKASIYAGNNQEYFYDIDNLFLNQKPHLIILAGFLSIIPQWFIALWSGKIINIHPALLPKYGGKGMYGKKVHEAIIANRETESGCTVHWVIPEIDKGDIIAQAKVTVAHNDDADSLQQKVLIQEHMLYPQVVVDLAKKIKDEAHL